MLSVGRVFDEPSSAVGMHDLLREAAYGWYH